VKNGSKDQLNTLIASSSLPDVITARYVELPVQMLQHSGDVLALDELAK
jgi:hypothetical protein